jgi:MYXO-CTERM domain-containing protein
LVGGVVADVMVPSFAPVGADCSPGAAGAEGDACACPMDCADGLVCAPDGSALACLVPCDPSGPPCPHASQTCSPLPNGGSVCLPPGGAPPEAIAEEDGCGCRGSSPGGLLFLAALALLVRRPRKG